MQPWHVVALFCEDIREEKSGDTLIGIFPDNLSVNAMPGVFPKLGIYFRIHIDLSTKIESISGKLRFPDGTERPLANFTDDLIAQTQKDAREKGAPLVGFLIRAVASPMPIVTAGRILAIAEINKQEIVCGALNIQKG